MKYIDGLRTQFKLFTLYSISVITALTLAMSFGYRTEPFVLDANYMRCILSFILTFVFVGPFWLKFFDQST